VGYFQTKTDIIKREISFMNYADSSQIGQLRYTKIDKNHYTYKGVFRKDSIECIL